MNTINILDGQGSVSTKRCSRCLEIKAIELFRKRAKGYESYCKQCEANYNKEYLKNWVIKNRNKSNTIKTKYQKSSKGKINSKYSKIKSRYGLTKEEYDRLIISTGNICSLCNNEFINNKYCVDHCHSTGKIRGIICDRCNKALGLVKDSKTTLMNMLNYLESNE